MTVYERECHIIEAKLHSDSSFEAETDFVLCLNIGIFLLHMESISSLHENRECNLPFTCMANFDKILP